MRGERFAPFGRRAAGAVLDLIALTFVWFLGFAGTAALAVSVFTLLPEGSSTNLSPVLYVFVATIPVWAVVGQFEPGGSEVRCQTML